MKNYPTAAEKAAEAPQAAEEKAPQAAEESEQQVAKEKAPRTVEEKAKPVLTKESEAASADKREIVSRGASMHRRRRVQGRGIPVQSTVRDIPIVDAVLSEMARPVMIHLPGGSQAYYAPQSFLVQPLYPTEGAPATAAQPARAETVGSTPAESQPSETAPLAPTEASYDPSLTEFWSPEAEKNNGSQPTSPVPKPVAPVAEPAAPAPKSVAPAAKPAASVAGSAPGLAPSPTGRTREEAREQEEKRMRRSVPLTIVNTFLFLGLLTAIAYLLMELGLLPKLF